MRLIRFAAWVLVAVVCALGYGCAGWFSGGIVPHAEYVAARDGGS